MRRERPDDTDECLDVELGENDNVIAMCSTCKKAVFVGNDRTQAGHRVLRERINEHYYWFGEDHAVDVMYPYRDNKLIDGMVHVSTGASITAIDGMIRQPRST